MKKIIPCLDIKGGKVVKGIKFEDVKDLGNPQDRPSQAAPARLGIES